MFSNNRLIELENENGKDEDILIVSVLIIMKKYWYKYIDIGRSDLITNLELCSYVR